MLIRAVNFLLTCRASNYDILPYGRGSKPPGLYEASARANLLMDGRFQIKISAQEQICLAHSQQ